mmetsp:Transcript_24410/g.45448  ORF Transcript_24410/g.45448 Transcript_24410/m.45448 type:complete len:138 (-) Transcript_24410:3074-3487(-)
MLYRHDRYWLHCCVKKLVLHGVLSLSSLLKYSCIPYSSNHSSIIFYCCYKINFSFNLRIITVLSVINLNNIVTISLSSIVLISIANSKNDPQNSQQPNAPQLRSNYGDERDDGQHKQHVIRTIILPPLLSAMASAVD